MPIFQKSVINNFLATIDKDMMEKSYQVFQNNFSPKKISLIKNLKEEEYQDGFLRDIFVDVLGYTLKPDDNFNLAREFKNQSDGKKADGAILQNDKAKAVIELKSTKTKDLKLITEQAFNYKNNQPECKYVITSNFQKIRFYIDYANEYEEFDLFHLNRQDFELLFLILCKDSILNDTPEKLKKESVTHEENVSKKLYANYSFFRNNLFENLIKNNPEIEKLTLLSKTQTLIDRFLFILFAEDKGLLPPNSISRIIERYNTLKEEDAYKPLYEIYKQYFGYMNIGRKGKSSMDDIPAYNGGLFYPDEILHNLIIDDDILINDLQKLSAYDFDTDVDVNILGHIFEHSLSEIEETTARIKGVDIDKTKTRRKKDGVFYTPQYITRYIVESTIGKLCTDKREELDILEIEIDDDCFNKKGELSKKGQTLDQKIEDYKTWLLSLKILDPACGSGAFLNQALTFLINEHNFIIEVQTDLRKGQISLFNVENAVLENNLYGVDINEESVEITKLSLWLRTAHRQRKLSNLNINIRCGNSLIDDPEIAGDKAFDWEKNFPEIMQNDGFDVVIGNPPYVGIQDIDWDSRRYYETIFKCAVGRFDLYSLFIEKSMQLRKRKSSFAFIIPGKFLNNNQFSNAREILCIGNNVRVVKIDDQVFEEAHVNSVIVESHSILMKNSIYEAYKLDKQKLTFLSKTDISTILESNKNVFRLEITSELEKLIAKIENNTLKTKEIAEVKDGIVAGGIKDKLFLNEKINEHCKKLYFGKHLTRYNLVDTDVWVNYQPEKMMTEEIKIKCNKRPGLWMRDEKIFLREKILSRFVGREIIATYDNEQKYYEHTLHSTHVIDKNYNIKFILALFNSKLFKFYYQKTNSKGGDIFPQVRISSVKNLPIKITATHDQKHFVEKVDIMLTENKKFYELKKDFFNFFTNELKPQKTSKKLESWNALEWNDFKNEIKKCKARDLNLKERKEWQDYFIEHKNKADALKSIISKTDKEIDLMIYKLYRLTQEEIEIVEKCYTTS